MFGFQQAVAPVFFLFCGYGSAATKTMVCDVPYDDVTGDEALRQLQQDMSRVESDTARRISELTSKIDRIESNSISRSLLDTCDIFYGGKCFALVMSTGRMNIVEAKRACTNIGGAPANIYSEEHFEKIRALLRSRIYISHTYNHIWTGMTVDISRRTLLKSNGQPAPYTRWYPGRPYTPARLYAGFYVEGDPNSSHQGMFDENGNYRLLGVLCEI